MKHPIYLFIFPIVLAGLLSANFVFAIESPSIVINEIAWMGSGIDNVESKNWWRYEWIELYNNTEQLISIDDWKIELYRDKLDYTIELFGNIKPNNYFLIVASDKIANYDLNYSNLTGKFVNSGQEILLKNTDGKIIEQIDCSTGWFYGDNKTKQTMERINADLSGNNPQNWQTSQNTGGTPKSQNSIIAKIETTTEIPSPDLPSVIPAETKIETENNPPTDEKPEKPNQIMNNHEKTKTKYPISSILIASITAIFSGTIIILLKNKTKNA
jgi:hypothetical protein